MTCAVSCVGRVERPEKVPGVQDASVNLATELARIVFAGDAQMPVRLKRAVRDAGYEPRSPAEVDAWNRYHRGPDLGPVALARCCRFRGHCPWWVTGLASIGCCQPGCSLRWRRRCNSYWVRAFSARLAGTAVLTRSGNMDLLVAIGTTAGWALVGVVVATGRRWCHGAPVL
ncbi:MAG: cation-translocating P-type ATPase [Burkholderiales bacterium]|nr:cation-translocating P-type ATPase [Burkholderiales bacterium]